MIWTPANSIHRAPLILPPKRTGKVHVASELKNFGWRTLRKRNKWKRDKLCRDFGYRKRLRRRGGFAGGYPCCCLVAGCDQCAENTFDHDMQVVIAGLANDVCSDCDSLNDSFVVPWAQDTGSACRWTLDISGVSTCDYNTMNVFIGNFIPNQITVRVEISAVGGINILWDVIWKPVDRVVDCTTLNNLVCPFASEFANSECDGSSSTATVTSI